MLRLWKRLSLLAFKLLGEVLWRTAEKTGHYLLFPVYPHHHCCSPWGGTYLSSSHSQLPLNPLKCREHPGRSFYKAGRGTCPIFVTSTQAHRLLLAEGQVGSIGRWRTPSLWSLPFCFQHTEDGRLTPPPNSRLLTWAEDGRPCIGVLLVRT